MDQHGIASLLETALAIVADGGLSKLSFRALAQAASVSVSSLTNLAGTKAQLLETLIDEARRQDHALCMPVLELASAGIALSGEDLAELADLQLETWAQTAPQAQVFWSELIQASATQPAIARAIAPWVAEQRAFWVRLSGAAPQDHAALRAQALFAFSIDERAHGAALQPIPAYRRLRRLCLLRLCNLDFADRGRDAQRAMFGHLVAQLGDLDDHVRIDPEDAATAGIKDIGLAVVAARVLVCEGASELTHRTVAARANVPTSTLAYHFRTREDLLKGAMQAIILSLKNALFVRDADPLFGDGEAPGYLIARSTFALALEAGRTSHLVASAADMRRKRGVNLVHHLNAALPRDRQVDALGAQVLSIAAAGQMMVDASCGTRIAAQASNLLIERLLAV